jgi:hypothetical protein
VYRAGSLLLLLFACLITSAQAHPAPFSYLDLRLGKSEIKATLTVHVTDLAYELRLTPPEVLFESSVVEAKRQEILDLLRSRLVLTADGTLSELELTRTTSVPDRHALSFDLEFRTRGLPGLLRIKPASMKRKHSYNRRFSLTLVRRLTTLQAAVRVHSQ